MADTLGTKLYDTIEEASAHQAKVEKLESYLLAMTPAERSEWFKLNGNNVEALLERMT